MPYESEQWGYLLVLVSSSSNVQPIVLGYMVPVERCTLWPIFSVRWLFTHSWREEWIQDFPKSINTK